MHSDEPVIDTQKEVEEWVDKHKTAGQLYWAFCIARASIHSLTKPDGINDPHELAIWQARLPLIRAKALLMGIPTED